MTIKNICKERQMLLTSFGSSSFWELTPDEWDIFLKHVENCPYCKPSHIAVRKFIGPIIPVVTQKYFSEHPVSPAKIETESLAEETLREVVKYYMKEKNLLGEGRNVNKETYITEVSHPIQPDTAVSDFVRLFERSSNISMSDDEIEIPIFRKPFDKLPEGFHIARSVFDSARTLGLPSSPRKRKIQKQPRETYEDKVIYTWLSPKLSKVAGLSGKIDIIVNRLRIGNFGEDKVMAVIEKNPYEEQIQNLRVVVTLKRYRKNRPEPEPFPIPVEMLRHTKEDKIAASLPIKRISNDEKWLISVEVFNTDSEEKIG